MAGNVNLQSGMSLQEIKARVGYQTDSDGRGVFTSKGSYFGSRSVKFVGSNGQNPSVQNKSDNLHPAFKLLRNALGPGSDELVKIAFNSSVNVKDAHLRPKVPLSARTMRKVLVRAEELSNSLRAYNSRRAQSFVAKTGPDSLWSEAVERAGWPPKLAGDATLKKVFFNALKRAPELSNQPLSGEKLQSIATEALTAHKDAVEHGLSESFPSLMENFQATITNLDRRGAVDTFLSDLKAGLTGQKGVLSDAPLDAKTALNETLDLFKQIDTELGKTEYDPAKLVDQRDRLNALSKDLNAKLSALSTLADQTNDQTIRDDLENISEVLTEDLNSLNGRLEFKKDEVNERLKDDPGSMRNQWKLRHDVAVGAYHAGIDQAMKFNKQITKLEEQKSRIEETLNKGGLSNRKAQNLRQKLSWTENRIEELRRPLENFIMALTQFRADEEAKFAAIPPGFRVENADKFPDANIDFFERPIPGKNLSVRDLFSKENMERNTSTHPQNAFNTSWGKAKVNELLRNSGLAGKVTSDQVKKGWVQARNAPENTPVSRQTFTVELGGVRSNYELVETPMSRSRTRNARIMRDFGIGQRITKDRRITPEEKQSLKTDDVFVAPINMRTANLYRVTHDKNGQPVREKAMEIFHHAVNDFYKMGSIFKSGSNRQREEANKAAANSILTEAMAHDPDWLENVSNSPRNDNEMFFVNVNYTNPRMTLGPFDMGNKEKEYTENQIKSFHDVTGQDETGHPQQTFKVDVDGQQDKEVKIRATYIEFRMPNKLEEDFPGGRQALYKSNQAALQTLVGGLSQGAPIGGKMAATVAKLEKVIQENAPNTADHQKAQKLLGELRQAVDQSRRVLTNHDYLDRSTLSYTSDHNQAGRQVAVMTNLWREATEFAEAGDRRTRVAYGDNCKSTKDRGPMGAASAMSGKILVDHGQSTTPGQTAGMSDPEQQEVFLALAATVGRNAGQQTSVHGSTLVGIEDVKHEILGFDFLTVDIEERNRRLAAARMAVGNSKGQAN